MTLIELNSCIKDAIKECQRIIDSHPNSVLSESDFEKLLSNCIADQINVDNNRTPNNDDFSIHTQISHYFDENGRTELDSRVDILLLKEHYLEACLNHKGFKYDKESIAIELKYYHTKDSIRSIECDFCKWERLREDSSLYVIALIDYEDSKDGHSIYNSKKKIIKDMCKKKKETIAKSKNKLFCYVLKKKI